MAPEAVALGVIVLTMGLAYGVVYPRLALTGTGLAKADLLVSLGLLVAIGWLFGGFDTGFSLLGWDTNWIVFTIVATAAVETPLLIWFLGRHGPHRGDDD